MGYFCKHCGARAIEIEDYERHCEKCDGRVIAYETFSGTRYRCQRCGHDSKSARIVPYVEIACDICGAAFRDYNENSGERGGAMNPANFFHKALRLLDGRRERGGEKGKKFSDSY